MNFKKGAGYAFVAGIAVITTWRVVDAGPGDAQMQAARQAYQRNKSAVGKRRYLTLVDYTKPVFATRLWVVDLQSGKVVLSSRVSHAFNSGLVYATNFSNVDGSEKSCAGSFVTQTTYSGKFGYSLKVRGLDKQNNNALTRYIVFHPHRIPVYSQGCWMTSPATNRKLIDLIKDGSFVYVAI